MGQDEVKPKVFLGVREGAGRGWRRHAGQGFRTTPRRPAPRSRSDPWRPTAAHEPHLSLLSVILPVSLYVDARGSVSHVSTPGPIRDEDDRRGSGAARCSGLRPGFPAESQTSRSRPFKVLLRGPLSGLVVRVAAQLGAAPPAMPLFLSVFRPGRGWPRLAVVEGNGREGEGPSRAWLGLGPM